MAAVTTAKLASLVNEHQVLLVYPIKNQAEPLSLWSLLYPRKKMVWEWDEDGDDRIADLWHQREVLSRSGRVVYSKWYQGRATFFSKKAFTLLLAAQNTPARESSFSTGDAKTVYGVLEEHSPQSTKSLKKLSDLQGRFFEPAYNKALKELFARGLIVGWGEKDEGAFPSLNLAAAKHLFETEWNAAKGISVEEASSQLKKLLAPQRKFLEFFLKSPFRPSLAI